jgi:hypothetical protein
VKLPRLTAAPMDVIHGAHSFKEIRAALKKAVKG